MGFFSGISDAIFGGTDDSAQEAQTRLNELTRADILHQARLGREDALRYGLRGNQALHSGYVEALEAMKRGMPGSLNSIRRGSNAAQGALIKGLPQVHNAILGDPVDLSYMQVRDVVPQDFLRNMLSGADIRQFTVNPRRTGYAPGDGPLEV